MIKPKCYPVNRPNLKVIEPVELASVTDDTYSKLQTNEALLQNWGIANEKILLEVCER